MARRWTPLLCLLALSPGLVFAQSTDAAAERARLANQRIQAEAERRAREELEQQRQAAAEEAPVAAPAAAPQPPASEPLPARAAASPVAAAAPGRTAVREAEISRALEQLRHLGELKDAGYVTDEEFQRIKNRILDERF